MNVLLVGGGGREHAIAWKLRQSKKMARLYIAPGNPGTAKIGTNVDISDTDLDGIVQFARNQQIDFAVIGPEDPLSAGLVDRLAAAGIRAFGPSKEAAQLEADKSFAKHIMRANSIPTAESRVFSDYEDAKAYIASRDEPVVIKASGLAKGKGVFVCEDPADGILAAEKIMVNRIFGSAGAKIIVEDKLLGQEVSILAFVDGRNIYVMESAQDHKPIGEGDTGPNTGGMGAYSPAPIVTDALMDQIIREILVPTVDGMNRNDTPYKGVLYAGLMITQGGPRVLEYNARFGDPETQVILPLLENRLGELFNASVDGALSGCDIRFARKSAITVVMASGGYPGNYEKGRPIAGLDAIPDGAIVFHAGTERRGDELYTAGGRVLNVMATGSTLAEARDAAYEAVGRISFEGAFFRKDIGHRALG